MSISNLADRICIHDFNYEVEQKLKNIPRFESRSRFESQLDIENNSKILEILLTDDIIHDNDTIMALMVIIANCCAIENKYDVQYIESFFTANIFLGRDEYDIPLHFQLKFLEDETLQLNPKDMYFGVYMNTLPEMKKILELEDGGDFDLSYLSEKEIIPASSSKLRNFMLFTKSDIPIRRYSEYHPNPIRKSEYFNMIESPKKTINMYRIKHDTYSRIFNGINGLSNIDNYGIVFNNIILKILENKEVYVTGPSIGEMIFKYSKYVNRFVCTILITENYKTILLRILDILFNSISTMTTTFHDNFMIITGHIEIQWEWYSLTFIIPKNGFTLQSWFSNSVDSNCIALHKKENGLIDAIYSRRYEYSLSHGTNLVRPELTTVLDFYSYTIAKLGVIYPLVPAKLHLYNNYFAHALHNSFTKNHKNSLILIVKSLIDIDPSSYLYTCANPLSLNNIMNILEASNKKLLNKLLLEINNIKGVFNIKGDVYDYIRYFLSDKVEFSKDVHDILSCPPFVENDHNMEREDNSGEEYELDDDNLYQDDNSVEDN